MYKYLVKLNYELLNGGPEPLTQEGNNAPT